MSKTDDLLLEIGTEELPPKELQKLSEGLAVSVLQALTSNRLTVESSCARAFAAPRRLAVHVTAVADRQTPQILERKGPAISASFTKDGAPTAAALGFARSVGVAVEKLSRVETDRGAFLAFRERRKGASLRAVLGPLIDEALQRLPTGRRMRWGTGTLEFVRPVHWIVVLHGPRILPISLLGIKASRRTQGHRFHAPRSLAIPNALSYIDVLKTSGFVLADFHQRLETIRDQTETLAASIDARAVIDPELLSLVTSLVEWPHAVLGAFDEAFLDVPREALTAAMQDHQKYFPLERNGKLLPRFIAIANVQPRDDTAIRKGNERVLAARFADARFFWQNDRRKPLEEHSEGLDGLAFEQRLGSMADKVTRIKGLASHIARKSGLDEAQAARAAALSKADLLTGMVGEFPELQGVMGGYYARHARELPEVATAIAEHYRPRFSGDSLPTTGLGRVLAVADKLDTLVGIFGVGLAPTGDKDPFALRRAAIGVLRLLGALGAEEHCDLEVNALIESAVAQFPGALLAPETAPMVQDFLKERLRNFLEASWPEDAVNAALKNGLTRVLDITRRVQALTTFVQTPDAPTLITAHKRIRNILRQNNGPREEERPLVLTEPAEQRLASELEACQDAIKRQAAAGEYEQILHALGTLRPAIDGFFQDVLVMADDAEARRSRLTVLSRLAALFELMGDLSCLRVAGEAS